LGISRCALVGCAGGAQLALDFAVASPALVDAIVPVSPRVSGHRWEDEGLEVLEREVEAAVHDGDLERAMAIELAVWAPLSTGSPDSTARRIAFENAGVLALDGGRDEPAGSAVERLGDVAAATLVVVGDRDLEEIHQIADLLERSIPGASKRVIANADELVMVARPDRFNQVVLDFLAFRM
jgi:pimeloyl-ACP methyl ester carboxylesterase